MTFFSGEKMTGGYGGPDIITSCTINVNKGEIVAILGPNGAGKSTAMKAMQGILNLKSGIFKASTTALINAGVFEFFSSALVVMNYYQVVYLPHYYHLSL